MMAIDHMTESSTPNEPVAEATPASLQNGVSSILPGRFSQTSGIVPGLSVVTEGLRSTSFPSLNR
jgi:hypothetical protein